MSGSSAVSSPSPRHASAAASRASSASRGSGSGRASDGEAFVGLEMSPTAARLRPGRGGYDASRGSGIRGDGVEDGITAPRAAAAPRRSRRGSAQGSDKQPRAKLVPPRPARRLDVGRTNAASPASDPLRRAGTSSKHSKPGKPGKPGKRRPHRKSWRTRGHTSMSSSRASAAATSSLTAAAAAAAAAALAAAAGATGVVPQGPLAAGAHPPTQTGLPYRLRSVSDPAHVLPEANTGTPDKEPLDPLRSASVASAAAQQLMSMSTPVEMRASPMPPGVAASASAHAHAHGGAGVRRPVRVSAAGSRSPPPQSPVSMSLGQRWCVPSPVPSSSLPDGSVGLWPSTDGDRDGASNVKAGGGHATGDDGFSNNGAVTHRGRLDDHKLPSVPSSRRMMPAHGTGGSGGGGSGAGGGAIKFTQASKLRAASNSSSSIRRLVPTASWYVSTRSGSGPPSSLSSIGRPHAPDRPLRGPTALVHDRGSTDAAAMPTSTGTRYGGATTFQRYRKPGGASRRRR